VQSPNEDILGYYEHYENTTGINYLNLINKFRERPEWISGP